MNYTPRQVSEMLGVPESTLRRWAVMFRAQLSDQKGRKQRLYLDQDIYVFSQVKDLASQNIPLSEIGSRIVITGDTAGEANSALLLIPTISARFEQLEANNRAAFEQLDRQAATIEQLTNQIEQLSSQLEEIKDKNKSTWLYRLFHR